MTFERELTEALRAEAGTAEATPAKWDAVRASADSTRAPRSSQRWIVAGLSAAALIAIVVGIAFSLGQDQTNGPLTSQPTPSGVPTSKIAGPNGAPPYVVVVTNAGKMEIRESSNGEVVRTLDETFDPRFASPALATSPDGRYLYFDRPTVDDRCLGKTRDILRYDLGLGGSSVLTQGDSFALSPDGRRIAYVTSEACGDVRHLVTRTLDGAEEQRWAMMSGDGDIGSPHWSPDNRMVAIEIFIGQRSSVSLRLVDTKDGGGLSGLEDAQEIDVPEFTRTFGWLGGDELLGLATPEDQTKVVGFNTAGEQTRTLGVLPGVAEALSATGSLDGRHALVLLQAGGSSESTDVPTDRSLSIVSDGVDQPHTVTNDVMSAAWLSQLAADKEPDARTGPRAEAAPETIVAASAAGDILELNARNGSVIRTIAPRAPQPGLRNEDIALSPDGTYVFFENAVEDNPRGCAVSDNGATEIMRVRREGGPVEPVVTGRWPAISPDGRSLAFISYETCNGPGRLGVIAAQGGEDAQRFFAPRGISIDGPLSWDVAGNSVLVRPKRGNEWASSYIDTTSDERVVTGVADDEFFPASRISLSRASLTSGATLNYTANGRGGYTLIENGRSAGAESGVIRFGLDLLSWTSDAAGMNCLYISENDDVAPSLWTRTCRGSGEPTELPGHFTAAAW